MKIVHLSTSDRGGAGKAALRLHQALLAFGVHSEFLSLHCFEEDVPFHHRYVPERVTSRIYFTARKAMKYAGIYSLPHERMKLRYVSGSPDGWDNFSFEVSVNDLRKHRAVKEADLLHLHWISEGMINFPDFFSDLNKKILWTLHDMHPFTGGCHYSMECERYQLDCSPCPLLTGAKDEFYAGKWLKNKRKALSGLTEGDLEIVTPSSWLGKCSSRSALLGRFRHHVIPNAGNEHDFNISDSDTARKSLGIPANAKVVFFVAHKADDRRKGMRYLLEALLDEKLSDVFLLIAGEISGEIPLPNRLQLGYVTDNKILSNAYNAADVFVIPSLADNFPNTVCESLCCGTPVAAFDSGGIPELVGGISGICVPAGNSRMLGDAIREILRYPKRFLREKIRADFLEKVSTSVVVSKYHDLYLGMLK
ncbi:MAG: glycosyltransferase [Bacteroidia bacterium]|nr:glycosyltransferase [Bacteroidia bacterium]